MKQLYSSAVAVLLVCVASLLCPSVLADDGSATPAHWWERYYSWTEEDGTSHSARIDEPATTTRQIEALVGNVWYDRTIPGCFRTPWTGTWSADTVFTPTRYLSYDYKKAATTETNNSLYRNFIPFPEDIAKEANDTYTPYVEGITVLLVSMKSDYGSDGLAGWHTYNDDVYKPNMRNYYDHNISLIKSVQVLHSEARIESKYNPGTLVNVEADLDKFFIMTKGYVTNSVCQPFPYMFEEMSPVRAAFHAEGSNLYTKMLQGQKFPVTHTCSGIIGVNHIISMGGMSTRTEPVHANVMFYIPDYRLANPPSEPGTIYNLDRQPYFFTYNVVQAEPQVRPSRNDAREKEVTLQWTSSLKDVTGEAPTSAEEFCVLRRLAGTQEWEVVPQSQITIEQEGTSKDPESEVLVDRALDGTVRVIVHEAMEPDNREMEYMIDGRLKGSDFSMIESNVQHAYIDGYDVYSEPRIRITMAHTSHYGSAEQRNAYTDRIGIILNLRSEEIPMIRGHLSFDAAAPTRLRLARFTDPAEADLRDISHAADVPADLTIGWASAPGADGWYEYPVTGTLDDEPFTATLYSRSIGSPTDDLAAPILDAKVDGAQILPEGSADTPYTSELLVLTDRWGVSTATEADNHTYAYRIFASCLNITNYAEGILSDTRSLGMITLPIGAGCTPYTLGEITADTDGALAPNESQVSFTVGRLPKVDHAEIRAVMPTATTTSTSANPAGTAASEPLLAQLTRSVQNGAYTLTARAGADASQPLERVGASTGETGTYTFATPEVLRGKTIEMVTHLTNGNTYGAPRVYAPAMPTMEITALEEPWYLCGPQTLSTSALWSWHSGAKEGDPDFARLGFRAWSGEGSDGTTGLETTPFYDDFDAAAQPTAAVATPVTASYAPRHTPASRSAQATTDDPDTRQVDHTFNITQAVTPDGLPGATLAYRVRHYSEEPWNPGSGNYIVTDAPVVWQVKDTATGVEAIDPEADTAATDAGTNGTWYTIQGQLLPTAPTAPGLYIRRTSHGATKVRL